MFLFECGFLREGAKINTGGTEKKGRGTKKKKGWDGKNEGWDGKNEGGTEKLGRRTIIFFFSIKNVFSTRSFLFFSFSFFKTFLSTQNVFYRG